MFTAGGGQLRTVTLAVGVVITLLVYWIAEEYAEVLGEQTEEGKLAGRGNIRADLAATWPMVTTSYLPLLVLVGARLSGASDATAANVGLGAAVAVLTYHVWDAGRAARLRGRQLVLATCTGRGAGDRHDPAQELRAVASPLRDSGSGGFG
jgi:hypothetical protein